MVYIIFVCISCPLFWLAVDFSAGALLLISFLWFAVYLSTGCITTTGATTHFFVQLFSKNIFQSFFLYYFFLSQFYFWSLEKGIANGDWLFRRYCSSHHVFLQEYAITVFFLMPQNIYVNILYKIYFTFRTNDQKSKSIFVVFCSKLKFGEEPKLGNKDKLI